MRLDSVFIAALGLVCRFCVASNGNNSPGKFSLNLDGSEHSESEPDAAPEVKEEVDMPVCELLQPKLIT